MPTYVSLLRGINVSGRNRIAMADLRALYEAHEHRDVVTYVQSGNVISRSTTRSAAAVAAAIQRAITEELGLGVVVLVRTPAELGRVLTSNPFLVAGADPTKLHVTFLAESPHRARIDALDGDAFAPDHFAVGDARSICTVRTATGTRRSTTRTSNASSALPPRPETGRR